MKIYDLTVFGVKNLKWISLDNSGYQQVWISSGNSRRESVSLAFAASRGSPLSLIWGPISGCSVVKNLPAMQEAWVWSLDQEDPLEKGMATHSSILAWRIPWTEKPGGLPWVAKSQITTERLTLSSIFKAGNLGLSFNPEVLSLFLTLLPLSSTFEDSFD